MMNDRQEVVDKRKSSGTRKIRRASPDDAAALMPIAIAAKGYWGYPFDWMDKWVQLQMNYRASKEPNFS